jgi:hypothetical protein
MTEVSGCPSVGGPLLLASFVQPLLGGGQERQARGFGAGVLLGEVEGPSRP